VVATSLAGCYRSHAASPTGEGGSPIADASLPDAARGVDAGAARRPDAGPPPLPREEEPPVQPGERPSERPGSEQWEDIEPPAGVEPCCELGEAIQLTDPDSGGFGPFAIAWHGQGWGVAFSGGSFATAHRYVSLSPDVTEIRAATSGPSGFSGAEDGYWSAGRFAVTRMHYRREGAVLGLMDRDGVLDGGWASFETDRVAEITRQALGRRWVVLVSSPDPDGTLRPRIRSFDDGLTPREDYPLDGSLDGDAAAIASLDSLVVAAWAQDGRLVSQALVVGSDGADPLEVHGVFSGHPGSGVTAARFRDQALFTNMDGEAAWLTMIDPFSRTWQRARIADSEVVDRSAGVVGVEKFGIIGVCVPLGPSLGDPNPPPGAGSVLFQILRPDGSPWAPPITVAEQLDNVRSCEVAFQGDTFIVVWDANRAGPFGGLRARAVRPRL